MKRWLLFAKVIFRIVITLYKWLYSIGDVVQQLPLYAAQLFCMKRRWLDGLHVNICLRLVRAELLLFGIRKLPITIEWKDHMCPALFRNLSVGDVCKLAAPV